MPSNISSPNSEDLPAIDLATLREYFPYEEDVEDLVELSRGYFEDVEKALREMRDFVTRGEAQNARQAAHSIKSSSLAFGATRLFALCVEMEQLTKQGGMEGAFEKLAQIESEYSRVRVELPKIIEDMQ